MNKILQVIDTLNVGGAEKVFVNICNLLAENQMDSTALFLLEGGVLSKNMNDKILQIEIRRKSKWNLNALYRCYSYLKNYDIIHCHTKHVYRYIKLISLLFFLKKDIILHDHSSKKIAGKTKWLFKTLFKPKYYIGVSQKQCDFAVAELGISQNSTFLLENIIIKSEVKHYENNQYDFVLVSNIKAPKNQAFALKVLENSNRSLLLLGKIQDESYYDKYFKNTPVVISLKTDVFEVQPLLRNCQFGLHTSINETGPLVLIEYLAQGLPFLAYETGEVSRILKPYFPDFFIDNFNVEEWRARISYLQQQQPDYAKMASVFDKYFGKQDYLNKITTIYRCIKN